MSSSISTSSTTSAVSTENPPHHDVSYDVKKEKDPKIRYLMSYYGY